MDRVSLDRDGRVAILRLGWPGNRAIGDAMSEDLIVEFALSEAEFGEPKNKSARYRTWDFGSLAYWNTRSFPVGWAAYLDRYGANKSTDYGLTYQDAMNKLREHKTRER